MPDGQPGTRQYRVRPTPPSPSGHRLAALVVGTGMPDVRMRLKLLAGSTTLQASDWIEHQRRGRLSSVLPDSATPLLRATIPVSTFRSSSRTARSRYVRLVTTLEVQGIGATRTLEGGDSVVECRFTDTRGMKNREARFWSVESALGERHRRPCARRSRNSSVQDCRCCTRSRALPSGGDPC